MKRIIISTLLLFCFFANGMTAQEKVKILKAEDLPKHSYEVGNIDAQLFVRNEQKLLDLAQLIETDLINDLETYEIIDNSTLRNIYYNLTAVKLVKQEYPQALEFLLKARSYSDKEAQRFCSGINYEHLINAIIKENSNDKDKISEIIRESLTKRYAELDYNIVQDYLEQRKGLYEFFGENLIERSIKKEIQAAINNNNGIIPMNTAISLLDSYNLYKFFIPYQPIYLETITVALNKYSIKREPVDIWKDRNINITTNKKDNTVVIGVWDTGVDIDILPKNNQWINSNENKDGKDNDNNGFIDDINGIRYNVKGEKTSDNLIKIKTEISNPSEYQSSLKGMMDLYANINSNESSVLKKKISSLDADQLNSFIEKLGLYSNYAHGTHVAGITIEGNDLAEVLSAGLCFDYHLVPETPTEAIAKNWADMFINTVNYFKENNVKVVNMSWSVDYNYEFLRIFELNGVGKTDEDRKQLAKKLFDIEKEGFIKAVQSAPEILFVCAAGNQNNDVDFAGFFPGSLNFDNLITVGAVDIEGKKTEFTTEGLSVDVYANGFEVESYIPGGDKIPLSGTSMASPQVVNLAAKIYAVNPNLTPNEVIDLIIKTSTKSEEDKKVLLIHPKNAVTKAKAM